MKKNLLIILCAAILMPLCAYTPKSPSSALRHAEPESMGMDPAKLALADEAILKAIDGHIIPGAVLSVVRNDRVVYLKAYGNRSLVPETVAMTTDVVFDMASVSKCIGTTIAIMQLVEQGKIRLNDKASMYIPGFAPYVDPKTGEKVDITVQHLLTHSSGLAAYVKRPVLLSDYQEPYFDCLRNRIAKDIARSFRPGTDFRYSCLNFISLQYIVEKVTGERLCDYVQKNIFDVLGLKHTCYNPQGETLEMCAPTVLLSDGTLLRGVVQDPLARLINKGNSGNAGVFSNAEDLAVICAALMNGGAIDGKRILSPATVRTMAEIPAEYSPKVGRALGWDTFTRISGNRGELFPRSTIFHTGYTGTEIVIDLESKTSVILLANRCHPGDKHYSDMNLLRSRVSNIVAASIVE